MLEVHEIRAYNQTLGDCSDDYVQVTGKLEGETRSTTTCLTERTSKYYFYTPVYILFYSDSKSDSGIIFTFRTSLVKFLRKYQGRIESPGYPSGYPNNSLLTWILEAPMGFHTQLTFDDFRLEKEHNERCYDFVKIIETRQAEVNNRERSYCGTSMVKSWRTSGKQRMEVLFASDQDISAEGFSANWATVCGRTLEGNFGEFVGPNNASGYPENQTCTWNIRAQNGYKLFLALNVRGYNDMTSCSLDHIQVAEEQGEHKINGKRFCSGTLTLETTKSVTIIFHSDNDPTTGLSFNASWLSKCGETFDINSGELASPDNHVDYNQEVRCSWTIRVSPEHTIVLNYSLPKISNDEPPCTPYVQVTETDSSASKILCKSNAFAVYRSSSNTLHISFTHEPRMNYARLYAKWHAEYALMYNQAESSSGSIQALLVNLPMKYRKVNESSLSVADVIVQTAAPPMAFVIVVLIIFLIVQRRKSIFSVSKEADEATYDTEDTIYSSINEKNINVEINALSMTNNIHHFSKKRSESQTFRQRLPNPPTGRLSSVLARVKKSMHLGNEYDTVYGESTERHNISFIGDNTELHECRPEVTHSKQERFSQGLQSTMENFTNSGYMSPTEDDQGKKEYACSRNIVETDCVVLDTYVETSDNEGYITAVHSSITERSPSIVESDSIR
ncbi:hypothetical protein CHS0354_015458 [Potamilus streckersoni]|uniref:CUB domain-containing protein n=1 Tax=Potamilus streckersoni TaxID=2493646 RepID=A0AAE0RQZ8_9BIVA|nr:hypothetical protein CHS0354_015458 [Potamilus streckersoni]